MISFKKELDELNEVKYYCGSDSIFSKKISIPWLQDVGILSSSQMLLNNNLYMEIDNVCQIPVPLQCIIIEYMIDIHNISVDVYRVSYLAGFDTFEIHDDKFEFKFDMESISHGVIDIQIHSEFSEIFLHVTKESFETDRHSMWKIDGIFLEELLYSFNYESNLGLMNSLSTKRYKQCTFKSIEVGYKNLISGLLPDFNRKDFYFYRESYVSCKSYRHYGSSQYGDNSYICVKKDISTIRPFIQLYQLLNFLYDDKLPKRKPLQNI